MGGAADQEQDACLAQVGLDLEAARVCRGDLDSRAP